MKLQYFMLKRCCDHANIRFRNGIIVMRRTAPRQWEAETISAKCFYNDIHDREPTDDQLAATDDNRTVYPRRKTKPTP